MKVDVFGRYMDITSDDVKGRNVVVIDVFRTTSVIVTALDNGAECIFPAESIQEAWELFNRSRDGKTLLGGERNALPITGFHLDNSPMSYTREKVRGKKIVLTTSNGTRAIRVCIGAENLFIASFLNVSRVVDTLGHQERDVSLVCSGTHGTFSLEDGLCAGMIVSALAKKKDVTVSDLGWAMKSLYQSEPDIKNALREGSLAYRYLLQTGYTDDIEICLRCDVSATLPAYHSDCVRPL